MPTMKKPNSATPTSVPNDVEQEESLHSFIPFWRNWEIISKYQKDIADNLRDAAWGDGFQKSLQLAPTNLVQSILPSSFSLFQFTKEMRGNPAVETKIVSEVAGYGSQLGTILDF